MKKRVLSVMLTLVMVLGALPAAALAAPSAERSELPASDASHPEERSQQAQAAQEDQDAIFQMEEGGKWYAAPLGAALHYVYEGGTVMLLRDFYVSQQTGSAYLTKPMTLTSYDDPDTRERETYAITTKINGHPSLLVVQGAEARLEHVAVDGGSGRGLLATQALVLVNGGHLHMGEGAVIRNNANIHYAENKWAGGGVMVAGRMTMEAGSLVENCYAVLGGGVAVVNSTGSTLTVDGGTIRNCQGVQGGGVFVGKGKFTLSSGEVKGNRAVKEPQGPYANVAQKQIDSGKTDVRSPGEGGGAFLIWDSCAMEMTGGALRDNSAATCGGGIGCDNGALTLSGGEITGNRAELYGGGVLLSPYLKVALSGSVRIQGNASGERGYEDLYLDGSEDWVGDAEGATATEPFVIIGPMETDIDLSSLARWMAPIKDDPQRVYRVVAEPGEGHTITEADAAHFTSSDPKYVVRLMELDGVNKLVLTFPTVTYRDGLEGAVFEEKSYLCTGGDPTPAFSDPEREGYAFVGWRPAVEARVSGDTVYTAQWERKTRPVVFDVQNHGDTPEGQTVALGDKAENPAEPTALGYDFGGWYQEPECERAWQFDVYTVSEDTQQPLILYAKWTPTPYTITYELEGGENNAENPTGYTIESETITLAPPVKEGHIFLGWLQGDGELEECPTILRGSIGCRAYTAQWEPVICPVTFDIQGYGTAPEDQRVSWGDKATAPAGPTAQGYDFGGWYKEPACQTPWDFETDLVTEAVTLYAKWTSRPSARPRPSGRPGGQEPEDTPAPTHPQLEREEHFAYIIGYSDGSVRPEGNLLRAEAATIFFRLMTESSRAAYWSEENPFPDAGAGRWYHNAVSVGVQAGLVNGLPDGTFGGERAITRAEFAAMAARFLSEETALDSGFADMTGHWAKAEVDRAVAAGWLKGYADGLFHPDDPITRAQVMALVNRMLGRSPDVQGMHPDMRRWPDNEVGAWYYGDVQEATNSHSYDRDAQTGAERWTALREGSDWAALE